MSVFGMLLAVFMCASYPEEPGCKHSKRRDEQWLGRRGLIIHTDPKVVSDLYLGQETQQS